MPDPEVAGIPHGLLVGRALVVGGRSIVVVIHPDIVGVGCLVDLGHLDPDDGGVGAGIPGFDFVLQLGAGDGVCEAHVRADGRAQIEVGDVRGVQRHQNRKIHQIVGCLVRVVEGNLGAVEPTRIPPGIVRPGYVCGRKQENDDQPQREKAGPMETASVR